MDRQQISWLIVRAFGLYLLIQAVMLVPDLLVGLYATRAYSNLVSSMGSDNNNLALTARAATSMYRSLLFGPLLKFVLFSVAGIYLLRRGGFVMRLLQRAPDTPTALGGDDDAQQIVGHFRMTTKVITCTHCNTDNTVTQCLECGRNFAVTVAHLAGRLRDLTGPIANVTAAPPTRCDFCSYQVLGDTLAALEAGLRQRTCPACHTEFLSQHGL